MSLMSFSVTCSKKFLSIGDDGLFARSRSLFWGLKYKLSAVRFSC